TPGSSVQSTPFQVGRPSGGTPLGTGGSGVHVLSEQARPAKQSALVAHLPPRSPPPSGWQTAGKPTRLPRRPEAQSPSLLPGAPAVPFPAAVQVRFGPQ